jgi:putative Mn2+ efflux pump MntP
MDILSLFLLALGLSLDDFALAFALCLILPAPSTTSRLKQASKMALAFAVSTALLPLVGWLIGVAIYAWVSAFSGWVILVVFCGVGAWIIKEAFEDENDKWKGKNITSFWVLVTLVFAAAFLTTWTSRLNQKIPSILSGIILIALGITNWIDIVF